MLKTNQNRGKRTMVFLLIIILLIMVGTFSFMYLTKGKISEDSLISLSVDASNYSVRSDESRLIFATAHYSNGNKENVNEDSQFSSSDSDIATVDSSGNVTGKREGITKITVEYKGISKEIKVSVTNDFLQVNVKEFGARGDGVQDDTNAFQNAIDYLGARNGGDLLIPPGTYILHPIFLQPYVNLVGENRDTVILKLSDYASDEQTRLIEMNHNTKVQSITCDGNYQNHPNGSEHMHCIFAYDKDHLVIENSKLMNAVGDGISISGSDRASNYVVISNNTVQENQRSQIVIEQVNHLRINHNLIQSETGRPGIHFEPWEEVQYYDAKIFDNTISTNTEGYCVLLTGGDSEGAGGEEKGYFYHGIEFNQNTVTCPTGYIRIVDTSGLELYENKLNVKYIHVWRKNKNVKIFNNIVKAEEGVRIEGGGEGTLISEGTEVYGNKFHTTNIGISIQEAADKVDIHNNQLVGQEKDSGVKIFASEDVDQVNIANNSFSHYENGVYFDYGEYGEAQLDNVRIRENRFTDILDYALYVMGPVQDVLIEQNIMTNSSGVYVNVHEGWPMSNIEISNNKISGGKRGILQTGFGSGKLDGLTITKNRIEDLTETGEGALTGSAIELDRYSTPPMNVVITENVLTNNAKNSITAPESLLKSVYNNKMK